MAEGKSLKFQFVLDEQSFARVKRALGELTTEAQKFAKAMQGGGGGSLFNGANVGRPPSAIQSQGRQQQKTGVGAAILGDIEAFQKLAKSGKDGMNAMTDAVRKGIREQMQEIEKLDRKMASLQSRFQKDPRAAYEGAFRENLQRQMLTRQGQLNTAQDNLSQLKAAQAGLEPQQQGSKLGLIPSAAAVATGVGIAVKAFQVSSGITGIMSENAAARGGATGDLLRRTRTADISDQLKLRYMETMDPTERAKLFSRVAGSDRTTSDLMSSMWSAAKGNIGALSTNAGDTRTFERIKEAMDLAAQDARFTENLGRGYEFAESTRGTRLNSARIRGAGFYRAPALDGRDPGRWIDTFTKTSANLTRQGYSDAELDSAVIQARNMGGRQFARRNAGAIMAANAVGYGGYGNVLAAAERSGGGSNLAALTAMGGKIDTAAAIQLGQGVLGSGFDVRGTTRGMGILGAAQGPGFNFTGGPGDFNQVQQILAGMQLGSSISTGGMDQYQAGRNIISAIGINPSGSTYAQDYLGTGMSLKQMMDAAGGDLTKTAKALGIDSNMAKQQLSGSMSSVMDRFVDQGGSDPMSRAIRGFRKSGVSIDEYLGGLYKSGKRDEADAIGAYFGMVSGEGEEAGIGLAGLLGGVGNKGKLGRGPAGSLDDESKRKQEALAKQIEQAGEILKSNLDIITEAFAKNEGFGKLVGDFGKLDVSVQNVITEFEKLAGITPEVKEAIDRSGIKGTLVTGPIRDAQNRRATHTKGGAPGQVPPTWGSK